MQLPQHYTLTLHM